MLGLVQAILGSRVQQVVQGGKKSFSPELRDIVLVKAESGDRMLLGLVVGSTMTLLHILFNSSCNFSLNTCMIPPWGV